MSEEFFKNKIFVYNVFGNKSKTSRKMHIFTMGGIVAPRSQFFQTGSYNLQLGCEEKTIIAFTQK